MPDIAAVYLFGSQAQGKANFSSDIDVAVLYEKDRVPTVFDALQSKEELVSLLKKEVDFVVMNRANPILKHQIFKHGIKIMDRHSQFLGRFFVQSLMEYDDIKRVRAIIEKNILKGRVYG